MPHLRIDGPADLAAWRRRAMKLESRFRARVLVCMTGCRSLGAIEVAAAFRDTLSSKGLADEVAVVDVGCHGHCARAPVILIEPQDYLYGGVTPADVPEIIETTLMKGLPVKHLCENINGRVAARLMDVDFYRHQKKQVLRNCGRLDPKCIEAAVARGGYEAASKALLEMSPDAVIDEIIGAGLRGRGGAGFPSGLKWRFTRNSPGTEKYLICNADEGDPGAFMDRALLEGDPHRVIEGMIIAAYAVGATKGFIYVRAEYPIAVEHVGIALEQARQHGLLGRNIMGSCLNFDIEVRMGAGAFVCGEESALIASLEGKRGMPRPRPPFPAQKGYLGKPTCINNVETLSNISTIIGNGKAAYASVGTEGSKGTKIFALAGKVRNTGLVEVPMGITLREIVFDIGGGIPNGRKFKAAQMGGPSGGCVPEEFLDLKIDYDSVQKIGAIMGSGGLVVMDEDTCMVDIARFFLKFTQEESCGKCVPCRVGTRHMLDILTRICTGDGKGEDLDCLEALAHDVKESSLCGLGQTAPNPILTTLKYFRNEYETHIVDKHCPAHVCQGLFKYEVLTDVCTGCTACFRVCPANAIKSERKKPHIIDQAKCIHCGACFEACLFSAIAKV